MYDLRRSRYYLFCSWVSLIIKSAKTPRFLQYPAIHKGKLSERHQIEEPCYLPIVAESEVAQVKSLKLREIHVTEVKFWKIAPKISRAELQFCETMSGWGKPKSRKLRKECLDLRNESLKFWIMGEKASERDLQLLRLAEKSCKLMVCGPVEVGAASELLNV